MFQETIMSRETPGTTQPPSAEPQVINDPGNEDPGSLMDDAQVPLLEAPPAQEDDSSDDA
ncbi:hypothetical protein DNK59_09315 [Pseudomonas sp. TKO26]|nr:hypothetical protein DNK62_09315 [Pseudomonas sp. TKO30]PYY91095.1 hypothetical protein DNK61_09315 [Pseudomonas sp. TKO29]PYY93969.1 hypothetical protein DNK59_09315 [Pseudomonas sp. TKO26]PYZ00698.1 hypothetical protein DNK60_09315 [Pseudomonas sp. TKO14]